MITDFTTSNEPTGTYKTQEQLSTTLTEAIADVAEQASEGAHLMKNSAKNSVLVVSRSKLNKLAKDSGYSAREVDQDSRALHAMLAVLEDYKLEIEALRHRYAHADTKNEQGIHRLLNARSYLKLQETNEEVLKSFSFGSRRKRSSEAQEDAF